MYKYLFLITATLFLSSCSTDTDGSIDNEPKDTTLSATSKPNPKPKTTAEERLTNFEVMMIRDSYPTLESAIAGYRDEDLMAEELANNQDASDFMRKLVIWDALVGMNWDELNSIPETNYKKMDKDIIAESGKRFCFKGRVERIQVDRTVKPAFADAIMVVPYEGRVAIVAVKSSGDILPDTEARFCGIVAGTRSYQTIIGATGSLPDLVGMFDLPENK